MNIGRMIFKEMCHSVVSTMLALVAVIAATASVTAMLTSLELHDKRTDALMEQRRVETEERVAALQDDYRKMMAKMGFNVLILPKNQDLSDFHSESFATADMPEEYVTRLASSPIVTVRHLLPSIQAKVNLKKYKRKAILMGIQDEVPISEQDPTGNLIQTVKPGTVVLGHEIQQGTGLAVGENINILGRDFTVARVHGERGNKDDITVWMDLREAQMLLKKTGRISAIHALECMCAWADVEKVRNEIYKILPDTKIIESADKALTRAEVRRRAAKEAQAALDAFVANRQRLRAERRSFAAKLIPVIIVSAGLWLALLTFGNVNSRQFEIALLRSLGMSVRGVMQVFLLKAVALGAAGAVIGSLVGVLVGLSDLVRMGAMSPTLFAMFFDPGVMGAMIIGSAVLSVAAAWVPVAYGCGRDPAVVLSRE